MDRVREASERPRERRTGKTRAKLLARAVELLRAEGIDAVTTKRLTRHLGITQPAFYMHFEDIEACRAEAVELLADELVVFIETMHGSLREVDPFDPATLERHYARVVERALEDRELARLLVLGTRQESILDDRVEAARQRIVTEIALHMNTVAEALGYPADDALARKEALIVLNEVLTMIRLLLDGALTDRDEVARLLAHQTLSLASFFWGDALGVPKENP